MRLHILEPTLVNEAGHCWALVRMLAEARPEAAGVVWASARIPPRLQPAPGWEVQPFFQRRIRRLQYAWLLARLLRRGACVFTPTTSRSELAVYALVPRAWRKKGRAVFYIHQMRLDARGRKKLRWIAARAPEARLLATHPGLAEALRAAGFAHVHHQPYPIAGIAPASEPAPFRHFLYPGMARMDKGLALLARIVEALARSPEPPPLLVQAAPNHHGEYAPEVQKLLARIRAHAWPELTMPMRALDDHAYRAQFSGAVCLQPYDPAAYANKITSVALDALALGAPLVVQDGLWSADIVRRFGAGIVVQDAEPQAWIAAMQEARHRYMELAQNALIAARTLAEEHAPARLWARIVEDAA